jgi:AcrR family transcriptional regulator
MDENNIERSRRSGIDIDVDIHLDIERIAQAALNQGPATPGDERRRSLVLAAYHLIAEGGLERLRTRDIAARAGMNIATLHYYFPGKEDLIRSVVEYLLQQFMTAYTTRAFSPMTTPLERLRGEISEFQYLTRERPEMFVVLSELVLRSLRDPAIHRMLQWMDHAWHAYLAQILREGIQQGEFRADLDPDHEATRLILLFKGSELHQFTSPQAIDIERLGQDIERWLTGQT